MSWGYENNKALAIEEQIAALDIQVEAVFRSLGEKGLGDIFRDAVLGGEVSETSFAGLAADVVADLKEVFNGAGMAAGGNVRSIGQNKGFSYRAEMIKNLFYRAAERGNVTAYAVKADLARLAFLAAKMDLLKQEQVRIAAAAAVSALKAA